MFRTLKLIAYGSMCIFCFVAAGELFTKIPAIGAALLLLGLFGLYLTAQEADSISE